MVEEAKLRCSACDPGEEGALPVKPVEGLTVAEGLGGLTLGLPWQSLA